LKRKKNLKLKKNQKLKNNQKKIISFARFVKDVNLEDGAELEPGKEFKKIWKVKNTGNENWEEGVSILYIGGSEEFGIKLNSKYPAVTAKPNEDVDVSVNLFAPKTQGVYEASFRLCTKDGEEFGNKLNLKVVVIEKKQEKETKKWFNELIFLHDMGFTDDKINVQLLEKHNGDLQTVVQNILK